MYIYFYKTSKIPILYEFAIKFICSYSKAMVLLAEDATKTKIVLTQCTL